MDDFLSSITDALEQSGFDLSSIHDMSQLAGALGATGIDVSALTDQQLDYILNNLHHVSPGALQFGASGHEWVDGAHSGYAYERINGEYTGNYVKKS